MVVEQGRSTVIDRHLMEAKKAIGDYAIVWVPGLDAALEPAASFPVPDGKAEARPISGR
ncbi:hypothetical protein [Streptomyces sp. MMG1121]|uniref:hypothetical protein n=1 Tax=Streptomyces sp. MMG1121 TaxID=1415544 RepID=UPI00131DE367|nr:hypothetical protein [Streptomyces sp. MMG1121]